MDINFNFGSGTSSAAIWAAAAATCSAAAAICSGVGTSLTAWINWNNRIDSVRPELFFANCKVDEDGSITIGSIQNRGAGPANNISWRIINIGASPGIDQNLVFFNDIGQFYHSEELPFLSASETKIFSAHYKIITILKVYRNSTLISEVDKIALDDIINYCNEKNTMF